MRKENVGKNSEFEMMRAKWWMQMVRQGYFVFELRGSNVENFGKEPILVSRFFQGEIVLQKYYPAQWQM